MLRSVTAAPSERGGAQEGDVEWILGDGDVNRRLSAPLRPNRSRESHGIGNVTSP